MLSRKSLTIAVIYLCVFLLAGAGLHKVLTDDVDMHGKPKVQQTK